MILKYVNLNTKIRAMYARIFKVQDYEELLRQSSVKTSLMVLKSKEEYKPYLKDIEKERTRLNSVVETVRAETKSQTSMEIERLEGILNARRNELVESIYDRIIGKAYNTYLDNTHLTSSNGSVIGRQSYDS